MQQKKVVILNTIKTNNDIAEILTNDKYVFKLNNEETRNILRTARNVFIKSFKIRIQE